MKQMSLVRKTQFLAMAILFLATFFASLFLHADEAAPTAIDAGQFKETENAEPTAIVVLPSTAAELAMTRPSVLRKLGMHTFNGGKAFGSQAALFYAALGIVAYENLLLKPGNDPGALKRFIDSQLKDPVSYVSFAGFMLGDVATRRLLNTMGLIPSAHQVLSGQVSTVQKLFGPLIGPLGMTGGMFISNVISELGHDKNVRICMQQTFNVDFGIKKDTRTATGEDEWNSACDRAYDDWTAQNKFNEWAPDLLAMVGTSLAQAYVVNKAIAWAAERTVKKLVFRGIQITRVAEGIPGIDFIAGVANMVVFFNINPYLTAPVKNIWYERHYSNQIPEHADELISELGRIEKNNWVFTPKLTPTNCEVPGDDPPSVYGEDVASTIYANPCNYDLRTPDQILRQYSDLQQKWRSQILQEASTARSGWSDYVLEFAGTYEASEKLYNQILNQIAQKNIRGSAYNSIIGQDGKVLDGHALGLYTTHNFGNQFPIAIGENTSIVMGISAKAAQDAIDELNRILNSPQEISILRSNEIAMLKRVLYSLQFSLPKMQISQTTPGFLMATNLPFYKYAKLNDSQKRIVEIDFRNRMVMPGLAIINDNLKHADARKGLGFENDLLRIKNLLGANFQSYREGEEFLADIESDFTTADPELVVRHPEHIGSRAGTPRLTDFLVASMVCGPRADQSNQAVLYQERSSIEKATDLASMVVGLSLNNRAPENALAYVQKLNFNRIASSPAMNGSSQDSMISREWGYAAAFRPPRIIKNVSIDFCNVDPSANEVLTYQESYRVHPPYHVLRGDWKINDKVESGFLDIIKNNYNPDLVSIDGSAFTTWWQANVNPPVKQAVGIFESQYREMINELFLPAFNRPGFKVVNGRQFSYSVVGSLLEDARFNLKVLGRVTLNSVLSVDELDRNLESQSQNLVQLKLQSANAKKLNIKQDYVKHALAIMKVLSEMIQIIGTSDAGSALSEQVTVSRNSVGGPSADEQKNFEKLKATYEKLVDELKEGLPASDDHDVKVKVAKRAVTNLAKLSDELASYYQIVLGPQHDVQMTNAAEDDSAQN